MSMASIIQDCPPVTYWLFCLIKKIKVKISIYICPNIYLYFIMEDHNYKLFHSLKLYESFTSSSTSNKEVILNYLSNNNDVKFFNDIKKDNNNNNNNNNNIPSLENKDNEIRIFNTSNKLLDLLNIPKIYNILSDYLSITEMIQFYTFINNNNTINIDNRNNNTNNIITKESIINQWVKNISYRRDIENEILYLKLKTLRTNLFCTDNNNSIDYILFIRLSQQLNSINESLALQSFQSSNNFNIINSYMECVKILHQKFLDSILLLNQSTINSKKESNEIKNYMIHNLLDNLNENININNNNIYINNNNNNNEKILLLNKIYNDSINLMKLNIEKIHLYIINNINIDIPDFDIINNNNDSINNFSHDILLKEYDDKILVEHEQFTKQLFDSFDNCMNIIIKHMENNLISEEH